MENKKQVGGGSSSSFTVDLFGPKDFSSSSSSSSSSPSSPSSQLFGSVFGPQSTGLGRDSSHLGVGGSHRKLDLGSQYGNGKYGTPDNNNNISYRGKGEGSGGIPGKVDNNNSSSYNYQNETVEPCYFNSSIYYGAQEVYSPQSQPSASSHHHYFKKDGGEDDQNGNNLNSATRGNWWQGSLYY